MHNNVASYRFPAPAHTTGLIAAMHVIQRARKQASRRGRRGRIAAGISTGGAKFRAQTRACPSSSGFVALKDRADSGAATGARSLDLSRIRETSMFRIPIQQSE